MMSLYIIPSIVFISLAFLIGVIGNSLVLFVYWRKLSVTPLKMLYRVMAICGLLSTIVILPGVIGNSLVLFVYWRKLSVTPLKILYRILAISGLLTSVVIIPGKTLELLNQWDYANHIVCKAIKYISASTTIGSGLVLLAIAVTRYRKICQPFGKQVSLTQVKVITASIVITSLLCASPYGLMVGRQGVIQNDTMIYVCDVSDVYFHNNYMTFNTIFFTCVFLSAAVPSFVMYFLIWKKARKHKNNLWNKFPLVNGNHGDVDGEIDVTSNVASEEDPENREENISMNRHDGAEAGNSNIHSQRHGMSCGERQTRVTNFTNSDNEKDRGGDCVEDFIQGDVSDLNTRSTVSRDPNSVQMMDRRVASGGRADQGSTDRCKFLSGRSPSQEPDVHHGAMTTYGPGVVSGELSFPQRAVGQHAENKMRRTAGGADEQPQNLNKVKAELNGIQNFQENGPIIFTIDRSSLLMPPDPGVEILDLSAGDLETRHEIADPAVRQTELGRTTFLLLVICSKFVVSFFPFLVCEFYRSVNHDKFMDMSGTPEALFTLFYLSFLITGSANAIVYSLCDVNFRRECYKLFCRPSPV